MVVILGGNIAVVWIYGKLSLSKENTNLDNAQAWTDTRTHTHTHTQPPQPTSDGTTHIVSQRPGGCGPHPSVTHLLRQPAHTDFSQTRAQIALRGMKALKAFILPEFSPQRLKHLSFPHRSANGSRAGRAQSAELCAESSAETQNGLLFQVVCGL